MNLKKRECPVKMRLVPYGGGWTDVYADFGDGELYFIISDVMGDHFEMLMRALYHLYPENGDYENAEDFIDYKYGIFKGYGDDRTLEKIVEEVQDEDSPCSVGFIPWKVSFSWDEEGSGSNWIIELLI